MRTRTGIILLLALVFGGVAAYLAIDYIGGQDQADGPAQPEREMVRVAVAAADLEAGHVLAPEDVELVEWPAEAAPTNYIRERADAVGRGLLTPMSANEPLLPTKLARSEAGGGLPIVIPEGKRAVTISVDQVIGVAGFVLPGTRVDVVVIMDRPDADGSASKIVLQNLEVLSAGQSYQRQVGGEPMTVSVVTVLVTPEQAETLTLATTEGIIQLALRNPLDLASVDTDGATPQEVLGLQRQRTTAPRRVRPRPSTELQVEIYRGPERSVMEVDTTGGER